MKSVLGSVACLFTLFLASGCVVTTHGHGTSEPHQHASAEPQEHEHDPSKRPPRPDVHKPAKPERAETPDKKPTPVEPKPEKPRPVVDPKPEPKPVTPKPEPKPKPEVTPKPEPKPVTPKPEPKPEVTPKPQPETPPVVEPKPPKQPPFKPTPAEKPEKPITGIKGFKVGRPEGLRAGLPDALWIFKDAHGWYLRSTTDTKDLRRFSGRIWITEGAFQNVGASINELEDRFHKGPREIEFDFTTHGRIDGVNFDVVGAKCINFKLLIDGKEQPGLIRLGLDKVTPPRGTFAICL